MKQLPYLDADAVLDLVTMADAVDALRTSFAAGVRHVERTHIAIPEARAHFLAMPAADAVAAGVKLLMIQPANPPRGEPLIQGAYVLFDVEQGRPIALIDGAALTSLRTPAASAIATDALARTDVTTLAVYGTGAQGEAHIAAMRLVRPRLGELLIVGRTAASAAALAERASLPARVVEASEGATADVICCCTSSPTTLFAGGLVRAGAHLNLVGAYRPEQREVDADLVARATVAVDDLGAARAEAGDLVLAAAEGRFSWDRVAGDLVELSAGRLVRRAPDEITLFKSVGLAHEDLVVATLAARRAGLMAG